MCVGGSWSCVRMMVCVCAQLATGLGLRGMAEQFRLQKSSPRLGATMGHLIWQLQDNWPGQSFGLLNYGGEWKQQMHFVRRSFAPLLVTAAGPRGGSTISVHLVSDIPRQLRNCSVQASLWTFGATTARPAQTWAAHVREVLPGGVELALRVPSAVVVPSRTFLRMSVTCGGGVTTQNDHFVGNFSSSRRLLHTDPRCAAAGWRVTGRSCAFTVTCQAVVPFVVLDSAGMLGPGHFSDGAFAVVPGETKEIVYTPAGRGKACDLVRLKRVGVRIESLYSLLE